MLYGSYDIQGKIHTFRAKLSKLVSKQHCFSAIVYFSDFQCFPNKRNDVLELLEFLQLVHKHVELIIEIFIPFSIIQPESTKLGKKVI